MKLIYTLSIITTLLFISCCPESSNKISTDREAGTKKNPLTNQGTTIQANQSDITAEVVEVYKGKNDDYIIRAKVIDLKENPAYPGIAVQGEIYNLIPAFVLNESGGLSKDSETNERLLNLSNLHEGDKFNAIITFELNKGWFIQEVNL